MDARAGHFVEQIGDVPVPARSGTSSAAASKGCRTFHHASANLLLHSQPSTGVACEVEYCTTRIGVLPDPAQQRDCWWPAVADWEGTIVWRTPFGDSDGRMATWFLDNACTDHVPQLQFMVTLFHDLLSALNLEPLWGDFLTLSPYPAQRLAPHCACPFVMALLEDGLRKLSSVSCAMEGFQNVFYMKVTRILRLVHVLYLLPAPGYVPRQTLEPWNGWWSRCCIHQEVDRKWQFAEH